MVPRNIVSAQVGASKGSCLGVEKLQHTRPLLHVSPRTPKSNGLERNALALSYKRTRQAVPAGPCHIVEQLRRIPQSSHACNMTVLMQPVMAQHMTHCLLTLKFVSCC